MDIFRDFLSPDFMPHGYCYLWQPGLVWLHVLHAKNTSRKIRRDCDDG
jgi:hypothetical protein